MIENMTDIVPQADEECFNIVCGDSRTFELRSTVSKQDAAAWVDALNKQRHVYDTHQRLAQYQAQQAILEAEQAKEAAAQRAASKETAAANAHHSATSYFTRLATSGTKPATPVGSLTLSATSSSLSATSSSSWSSSMLSPTASAPSSRLSFSSPTLPPRHGSISHAQPQRIDVGADAAAASDHSDDETVPAPPPLPAAPRDGQFDDEKHGHDSGGSDDDDLPPPPPSPPRSEPPSQSAGQTVPPMSLNSGTYSI
jgi:hypothetical protein